MDVLYKSVGILRYGSNYRLVLEIEQSISDYYRSMIPKYYRVNPPRYAAHVTVVRPEKEIPVNLEHWGKYEGESIPFLYDPILKSGKVYFWLNVFCSRLEDIRLELGLPVVSEYTLPPEGFKKCFHTTVANLKG